MYLLFLYFPNGYLSIVLIFRIHILFLISEDELFYYTQSINQSVSTYIPSMQNNSFDIYLTELYLVDVNHFL